MNIVSEDYLFEIATLGGEEIGLPFAVFISPMVEQHAARVKATKPPWDTNHEGVYLIDPPYDFVAGVDWLSAREKQLLVRWVELNHQTILDFWNRKIILDKDLRAKLIGLEDMPPRNWSEAVATMRAIAPKLHYVRWVKNKYLLVFDKFMPRTEKINQRFNALGFKEPVELTLSDFPQGILLWPRPTIGELT